MTGYILDASVAAKFYLSLPDEPFLDRALALLEAFREGRTRFYVPDLFWIETGNILWKATRRGRMSVRSAEHAMQALLELEIPTLPSADLLKQAFTIATSHDCSFYDSIYVAMAATTQVPLITADERLANSVAAYFPVRWLGAIA